MDAWAAEGAAANGAKQGDTKATRKLMAEIEAHAAELAGPSPSPLERTLAETAALCWFALRMAQGVYDRSTGLSLRQAEWHQRKIDHCHRRYLSTLKTLATVRRLGVPALQINLAQQQVNVAGT